jgi:hypothetical protein
MYRWDARVLVPGKSDVADFARLLRFQERGVRSVFIEDPVRVFEPDNLVMLHEVDAVGFEAAQRFMELFHGFFFRAAIDLGHEKDFVAVAIAEGFAHADFARAVVVVPRVVHEIDAAIDGLANDFHAELFADALQADVPASQSDGGHFFTGASKGAVWHIGTGGHDVLAGNVRMLGDANPAQNTRKSR